jgi:hypothetical protein
MSNIGSYLFRGEPLLVVCPVRFRDDPVGHVEWNPDVSDVFSISQPGQLVLVEGVPRVLQ